MPNKIKFSKVAAIALSFALLGAGIMTPPTASAASARAINRESSEALQEFKTDVNGAQDLLNKAHAFLIFPHVYEGGFLLGGKYGQGRLFVKGQPQGYYRILAGSVGFQAGGHRKSVLVAFMNPQALDNFLNSKNGFEIGADATVTVAAAGAEGSISSTTLNKPVIAFVFDQKGLMGGVQLEGSKITRINK